MKLLEAIVDKFWSALFYTLPRSSAKRNRDWTTGLLLAYHCQVKNFEDSIVFTLCDLFGGQKIITLVYVHA